MILHELNGHQIDPREVVAFYWQVVDDETVWLCCALRGGVEFMVEAQKLDRSLATSDESHEARGEKMCCEARQWLHRRVDT